jgi:type II secretory pathway pseudopilin PulG
MINKKGYSLVEALVYVLIFSLIFGSIVTATVLLSTSYRQIKAMRNIESSAISAMNRMSREIKNSVSVDTSATMYNSPSGVLLLDTASSTDDVRFHLSNGQVMLQEGSTPTGALTLDSATVSSLVFRPITTENSEAVKIEMTIQAQVKGAIISKNFYNTIVLRGSYE